jgi:hypothetical protein
MSTTLAITNLAAAITIEEASSWAKRMKIEAVETNKIPAAVARIGWYIFEG